MPKPVLTSQPSVARRVRPPALPGRGVARRLPALAVVGVLALTVAACGSGDGAGHARTDKAAAVPVNPPTPTAPDPAPDGPGARGASPTGPTETTAPGPSDPQPSASASAPSKPRPSAPPTGPASTTPGAPSSAATPRGSGHAAPADPPAPAANRAADIPPPLVPMGIVRSTTDPGHRTVALTFDDGPDPRWTPKVLALLDQYDVKATFCMVGPNASRHPDLVRRVVAAGHRLCDHSVTHDEQIDKRSAPRVEHEVVSARDEIARAAPGHDVDWFRAPGGAWSPTVRQVSAAYGMKPLGWSVDTRDWEKPGVDAILDNVRRELRPGGVVLMHDAGGDRTQSVEALARLLPWLKDQGYRFAFPG